jgi:superfamily II DNA or RNA helicase
MQTCIITIENEVSIKLDGLDLKTRRDCVKAVKYFLPHARYSAAFKLGRWDGTTSFCTVGGRTYLNLLDKILPIIKDSGYDIVIDDHRQSYEFDFENIDENFLSHLTWPEGHRAAGEPIMLRDYQVQCINECINNLQGLTIAATASGKCQPLSSKIKIPGGWTTMEAITVGDIITVPDGSNATVLNIYDPGIKDIYEITFEDGRKVKSCGDHLWKVHNHDWPGKWKILSLIDIIEKRKINQRAISIPLASMKFDNTNIDLPMNPYLLGALLGDGSFRENFGISSADQFILDKISSLLDNAYILHHNNNYDYSFKFKTPKIHAVARSNWMKLHPKNQNGKLVKGLPYPTYHKYKAIINDLGLKGTYSHTKFVPQMYLNAGYHQRIEMIQGLLDTDGYVNQRGCISFTTTSKQLAEDFAYLIRSVGGIARHTHGKNRTYKYKGVVTPCKDCYNVSVYHPTPSILVTLPRKLQLIEKRIKRVANNKLFGLARKALLNIIDIKKVSTEPVRCIMIDHPDHLYVTDEFVVTHNTIVTASLSMIAQKYGRTIIIVPNKNLVQQTEEDYRNIGLDVGVLYGDRKEYNKTHTICTWQSLNILDKKNKDALDENQFEVFMDNIVAVICDEVHLVKNTNVIHTLLTTTFAGIPIRWGLTGTIPEEEYNQVSLYSAIGPVIGNLTAKELQDAGHLAQCHVNMIQTTETVVYRTYPEELKYLVTNPIRLAWLAKMIKDIALTGNTLILIDRIETGKILQELIPECVFISGKMKATDRKEHYKDINLDNNAIMVATYGTTSTGISINRIFNLVLVEPGKSFVRVIQSIGRGLRKADDKDAISVFDISSKCKFSNKHMLKRKKFYDTAEYPWTLNKITY